MKAAISFMTFVMRHFLFVVIVIAAGLLSWTIAYLLLLLLAVITNEGVGGPFAYPAGAFLIIAAGTVLGWGMFAPASAVGSIFCAAFHLPRLAAIPVVFLSAFFLYYFLQWAYFELVTTKSTLSARTVLKSYALFLSVPLGVYWWLTEGPGALLEAFRHWLRNRRITEADNT